MTTLPQVKDAFAKSSERMPVLFIGHGSPMNAIDDNQYSRGWKEAAKKLPAPKAILSVSAHWETDGTYVTAMEKPKTIHDFAGFPKALFDAQYPAPGSADLARATAETIKRTKVGLDQTWGLDHGTWSVLMQMYPKADIPVLQLSLDATKAPEYHYELGKELRALRDRGVLIIGSGNIVHNLRMMRFDGKLYDWTTEFDQKVKGFIEKGDDQSAVHYEKLGSVANYAVPTNEHYLPLLYILGARDGKEEPQFFNDKLDMGSISMRSVRFG
jgi:4,5-DOPA dioxygenase extradiol